MQSRATMCMGVTVRLQRSGKSNNQQVCVLEGAQPALIPGMQVA